MQIQCALDLMDTRGALDELQLVNNAVDIVEIGTPMLIRFGLSALEAVKRAYPEKLLLADAKIMDGGEFEAEKCFEAGADIVTVMALAYDEFGLYNKSWGKAKKGRQSKPEQVE